LLKYHELRSPIGVLTEFRVEPEGLTATGKLVGSKSAREHVRALVGEGLLSAASLGFRANVDKDVWQPPAQKNGLAAVLRREATIGEVSAVYAAALAGSRVLRISNSNAAETPKVRGWDPADPLIAEADALLDAAALAHEESLRTLALADDLVASQRALDAELAEREQRAEVRRVLAERREDDRTHGLDPARAVVPAARTWRRSELPFELRWATDSRIIEDTPAPVVGSYVWG
jgi:HK97 family phage prohead protease